MYTEKREAQENNSMFVQSNNAVDRATKLWKQYQKEVSKFNEIEEQHILNSQGLRYEISCLAAESKELGLTFESFSKRTGIPKSTLRNWLNEYQGPISEVIKAHEEKTGEKIPKKTKKKLQGNLKPRKGEKLTKKTISDALEKEVKKSVEDVQLEEHIKDMRKALEFIQSVQLTRLDRTNVLGLYQILLSIFKEVESKIDINKRAKNELYN